MASRRTVVVLLACMALACVAGCAHRTSVLELQAVVLYDKPVIEAIEHRLDDRRSGGGDVSIEVVLRGDPGLTASFDISPGIAKQVALREDRPGRYVGTFVFPYDVLGGPYTILGRLRHEQAGEVIAQDPRPIFVTLPELDR